MRNLFKAVILTQTLVVISFAHMLITQSMKPGISFIHAMICFVVFVIDMYASDIAHHQFILPYHRVIERQLEQAGYRDLSTKPVGFIWYWRPAAIAGWLNLAMMIIFVYHYFNVEVWTRELVNKTPHYWALGMNFLGLGATYALWISLWRKHKSLRKKKKGDSS